MRGRFDRDDACVVNQLVRNDDVPRSLRDSKIRVVDGRDHRVGEAAAMDDAADTETVVFVRVARLTAEQAAACLRLNGSRLRGSRRKAAVRRIDDERRAPRVRVVFTPVRDGRARPLDFSRKDVDGREVALVTGPYVLETARILLVGQKL